MKFRMLSLLMVCLLLFPLLTSGMQFVGGKGLLYTMSPLTNTTGQLSFNMYSRGYFQNNPTMRHTTTAANVNFGFSNHIELGLTQLLYQDLELTPEDNKMMPGVTLVHFKLGNYSLKSGTRAIYFGAHVSGQYRTAKYYNIYLEPYVNEGITGEVNLLAAYYWKPFYLYESPAVHFNLGYKNHNDRTTLSASSQNIPMAAAFVLPKVKYDYSLELHGEFFIKDAPVAIYSRENFLYLTPSFKYRFFMGLAASVGLDILVYSEDEKSLASLLPDEDGYPQYPSWRINFKFSYMPSTAFYRVETFGKVERNALSRESLREQRVVSEKSSLFEWIVDENKGAEYIDLELEKIREERKKAEEELEKLKKEIEQSGK